MDGIHISQQTLDAIEKYCNDVLHIPVSDFEIEHWIIDYSFNPEKTQAWIDSGNIEGMAKYCQSVYYNEHVPSEGN